MLQEQKVEILIPEHLRHKCGKNLHWDYYEIDVKLRNGTIRNRMSVHSACAIMPTNNEPNDRYDFNSCDIEDIRPSTLIARLRTLFNGW